MKPEMALRGLVITAFAILFLTVMAEPALAQTTGSTGNIGTFIQMAANRLIVLKAGMPPVRGDKIVYWRERAFKRRLLAAPVVSARPVAEKTPMAVPSAPDGTRSSTPDPLTLDLDLASLPEGLPPLRDNATEAEVEAWVEHFIDASAQPREVSHAR